MILARYSNSYNYRKINYAPNGWINGIQDPNFPGSYHYDYYYNDNGTISGYSSWAGWDDFDYDANGRLTGWYYETLDGGSSLQENYRYDAAGNLLTKGNKTFTYNTANQITNAGFTYDANGNLTRDGSFIYTYNALNQLVQVNRASNGSLVATYTYNHNGLRRTKTVNGVTTNYNWDASGNLIRESTPSGNSYYYYNTSGELVGLIKNNQTYIMHDNLRGDIVSVTDTGGNIYAQYHFDPWGNQISYSGTLSQPIRYAGYYYDDETGLYYLKSRYYSPALGRFLTRDGIGYVDHVDPQTLNLYSYCGNNPVSLTDTDGNWANSHERDDAIKAGWSKSDINKMDQDGINYNLTKDTKYNADANKIRAKYSFKAYTPSSSAKKNSSASNLVSMAKGVHNAIMNGADALEAGGVSQQINNFGQGLAGYPPPVGYAGKGIVVLTDAIETAGNIDGLVNFLSNTIPSRGLAPQNPPPGFPDCRNNRNVPIYR